MSRIRCPVAKFAKDDLLFRERAQLAIRGHTGSSLCTGMGSTGNETQEEITTVILNGAAEDLLVGRDARGTLDAAQSMDCRTDGEVLATWDQNLGALVGSDRLSIGTGGVLDGDAGVANADGADVAAEDVSSVEGLARANGVVETFKVDYAKLLVRGVSSLSIHVLNPQFLWVRTRALSMGPKGLNTLRMVAGVVVAGMLPIHKARVGLDWV